MTMPLLAIAHLQGALADAAAMLRAVTVVVRASGHGGRGGPGGQGSGIVWSPDGIVVTNAHVVPAGATSVTFADGRSAAARLVARDPRRDLAVLRVDPSGVGALPTPTLGEPSLLRAGEVVVALGHPFGMAHSLSVGIVHAAPAGSPYLRADVRLAPGNSGGPLADARGRIVGVNSMIVGGLGVAISIDVVRRLLASGARRAA